jgi:hypothetical protein
MVYRLDIRCRDRIARLWRGVAGNDMLLGSQREGCSAMFMYHRVIAHESIGRGGRLHDKMRAFVSET